ncbi:tyrosine-type recombinase/integrase [Escherichia coli]|nr:tyrosine-type recombinase/integrase [Escherichia coli]EKH5997991.1 tyrosine-type recombinase/integrase [Escherichia coli O8]EEQ3958742.1 tyrosine-type recombinase/integrase [Escherichia coli]EEQ4525424.1 tyrosine-type recombinase/integrase [Escherichia coli]EER3886814.1 tyrosine-type recombinase/integrase [Escherichia coli]
MSVKPLTASEVKSARPREKDYALYDGFGLLLYVSKAGSKSWRFRYVQPFTKKRQTYTIGRYPDFTLVEAREERDNLRRLLARDIDPLSYRAEKRLEAKRKHLQTFGAIAIEWFNFKKKGDLRLSTLQTIEELLSRHIIPVFGNVYIHDMTAPVVIPLLNQFSDRNSVLDKIISKINEIMNYCVNSGVIKNNPLSTIRNAFATKKHTPLKALPVERLSEFLNWWDTTSNISIRCSLLFQIFTMVRPCEAREAKWEEIDLENCIWTIPPERMKCGREHVVPLSRQAVDILNEMNKIKCGSYIFFSPKNPGKAISSVLRHKCFKDGQFYGIATAHGFRAMWSTLLNEEGFNPDVIEAALAHKSGDAIRDIYNRSKYFEQRKIMMQWIGDFVDDARKGVIRRSGGHQGLKVVNM